MEKFLWSRYTKPHPGTLRYCFVGKKFVFHFSTTKTTKILPPEKYPLYGITVQYLPVATNTYNHEANELIPCVQSVYGCMVTCLSIGHLFLEDFLLFLQLLLLLLLLLNLSLQLSNLATALLQSRLLSLTNVPERDGGGRGEWKGERWRKRGEGEELKGKKVIGKNISHSCMYSQPDT